MAGEPRIIAFESGATQPDSEVFLLTEELAQPEAEAAAFPESDAETENDRREWLPPAIALGAIVVWTAFFIWASYPDLAAGLPVPALPGAIADWSLPVLLVGVAWLLVMRNSRREARRFGDVAHLLSSEAAKLEERLTVVNRELSLAREFIAAQARDLDALGRLAVDRLSANSERLDGLIRDNGARIDAIGTVSEAALDNLEKLRGQLPVIASSAKDVTNAIGNAGRTAHGQLSEMVKGFEQLNSFGQASERQVQSLRGKVDESLTGFARQVEHLEKVLAARIDALTARGAELRDQLTADETSALEAMRGRAAELGDEFSRTRRELDAQEEQSLTSLRARMAALRDEATAISRSIRDGESRSLDSWRQAVERIGEDLRNAAESFESVESAAVEAIRSRIEALVAESTEFEDRLAARRRTFSEELDRRREDVEANEALAVTRISERLALLDDAIARRLADRQQQTAALSEQGSAIAEHMAQIERQLAEVVARGCEAEARYSATVANLASGLAASRDILVNTDRDIAALTDSSVRLLEILQASQHHTQQDLQEAIDTSEQRLAAFESRIQTLRQSVSEAEERGENLSGLIAATADQMRSALQDIEQRQAALGENNSTHQEALAALRQTLSEIDRQSASLSERTQGELSAAIGQLLSAAEQAGDTIRQTGAGSVAELAERLGQESAEAIEKAMRDGAAEASAKLEQAATQAAGLSREATIQLRDQLAKVNELVGNLERRVAQARERAEEQVDNDFSRRAALITESLNSNAIDIAKALSTEVSDTAWSAYLRGDRGIFTRRAVSLIESGEAKGIAHIYEQDSEFREHVSRYIHDFEAILRQVLSTRDGHALGVTLLSSDMGKLYVALAQAIDRLRR